MNDYLIDSVNTTEKNKVSKVNMPIKTHLAVLYLLHGCYFLYGVLCIYSLCISNRQSNISKLVIYSKLLAWHSGFTHEDGKSAIVTLSRQQTLLGS